MRRSSASSPKVLWFSQAGSDLVAARLLYKKKLYGQALFSLQQASEKLAKGQLISLGLVQSAKAETTEGGSPLAGLSKEDARAYGHEVMPTLVSVLKEGLPRLKELRLSPLSPQPAVLPRELTRAIERTEKEIEELSGVMVRSPRAGEDLAIEIATINSVLDRLELAGVAIKQALDRKDERKMALRAQRELKRLGHNVSLEDIPPVRPYVESGISRIKEALICTLASELAWALFPLESRTRYPSSDRKSFDRANPYVKLFSRTWDTLDRLLKTVTA